jgi:hypothetical protein
LHFVHAQGKGGWDGVERGRTSSSALISPALYGWSTQVFSASMEALRSCVVRVASPILDFEVCSSHVVDVRVGDGSYESVTTVTVSVVNEVDPPVVTSVMVAAPAGVLSSLAPQVAPSTAFATSPSALGPTSGSWPAVELRPAGGSVLVLTGTNLGSPAAGGLHPSRAPPVSIAYWDASASPMVVLNSTNCVVAAGSSGGAGEVQCVTVPGAGNVTAVRVQVYGQLSSTFLVNLRHAAPVITSVSRLACSARYASFVMACFPHDTAIFVFVFALRGAGAAFVVEHQWNRGGHCVGHWIWSSWGCVPPCCTPWVSNIHELHCDHCRRRTVLHDCAG